MNRSQLKAKAHRREVRNKYRVMYGDLWIDYCVNWLRRRKGDI